jgi:hypothetical protein
LTQAAVHHGTNYQSRKTAEQISGCYYQDIDSQESNHPYQVNESILDNAGNIVGKDTSTLSGEELPGQCTKDNDGFNSVDKATDANGDPCKDSEHTDDAENMTVDQPDGIFDCVEVNTVTEGNNTHGHPSQESVVIVDATNVEQTESIVNFDVDRIGGTQQELPVQSASIQLIRQMA